MESDARSALEALVAERAAAVEDRAAERLLAQVGEEVLSFPVLPPTVTRGVGATEQAMRQWFDGYAEGPHYEPHLQAVDVAGDLGFVAYLYRVSGTLTSGDEIEMWVRTTLVCRRGDDGGWRVVHAHESVPFDPETGRALLDEAPPG